jgi:hypothetical protein
MNYIYKQLLFFALAFGVIVAMPAEIRQLVGSFAIGWVLADFAQKLFPKKNV